jgi:hypothetical protein
MSEKLLYIHTGMECDVDERRLAIAESLGFTVTRVADQMPMNVEAEERLIADVEQGQYAGVWLDIDGKIVARGGLSARSKTIVMKNSEAGKGIMGQADGDQAPMLLVAHIGLPIKDGDST